MHLGIDAGACGHAVATVALERQIEIDAFVDHVLLCCSAAQCDALWRGRRFRMSMPKQNVRTVDAKPQ